jgi:hypothetical protein
MIGAANPPLEIRVFREHCFYDLTRSQLLEILLFRH